MTKKNSGRFVIHKHHATRLHYDLRLEINSVLVSWAVPKGPSTNPADRRYAVRTPDHPLNYLEFEGVIPPGHYGAGPVMVWDIGTFKNIKKRDNKLVPLKQCLQEGFLMFSLEGHKLKGAYCLIRTSSKIKWLLIKMKDEYMFTPQKPLLLSKSVLTKRTLAGIRAFADKYLE